VKTTDSGVEKMAGVVEAFISQAKAALAALHPANMILLRGFAVQPDFPSMKECYKLKPACIATYPDYRGVAKMIGMDVLKTGMEIVEEVETLEQDWKSEHNFYFFHVKKTDSYGEDGNFDGRMHKIEEVDALIPRIMALNPDVFAVTGDHSTPAVFKAHTWHPVPVLLWGKTVRQDAVNTFSERAAICGGMGRFDGAELMLELLAHAGKMKKMGA
jgi:2,3-bisphosphoglycerate-independent phosphoglycerate mutase